MDLSSELMNLIIRFGFNLFIAFIIVKLIYHREHKDNDFVFTYFMFNSLIFFFSYLLSNITINLGFAFGLFAVFAILRYRTDPIPIKEMTYLFIVITIGVINALSGAEVSYAALLFTNIALVGLAYSLEIYWQNKVHERIVGTKTYAHLPPHEELSLYHPKTIEKQIKQNTYYEGLQK